MKRKIIVPLALFLLVISLMSGITACSAPKEVPGIYIPGTYTGTSQGMGPITVELTVDAHAIIEVNIMGPGETMGIGGKEGIENGIYAERIIEAQSAEIDIISGATLTSDGVRRATDDAIEQALR